MDPTDAAAKAIALAQQIEKLGVVGLLALIAMLASVAAFYFRKGLVKAHEQITLLKQMLVIVQSAADAAGVKYDFDRIAKLERELKGSA
jgi:hypothetical protein